MTHPRTPSQARNTFNALKFTLASAVVLGGGFAAAPAIAQTQLDTRFDVKGIYAGMPQDAFLKAMGKSIECQSTAVLLKESSQALLQLEAGLKAYEAGDKSALKAGVTAEEVAQAKQLLPTLKGVTQAYEDFHAAGSVKHCETTETGFTMAERPVKFSASLNKNIVMAVNFLVPAEHWPSVSEAISKKYAGSSREWLRGQMKAGQVFFIDKHGQTVVAKTLGQTLQSMTGEQAKPVPGQGTAVLAPSNVTFTLTEGATAQAIGLAKLKQQEARKPKDI